MAGVLSFNTPPTMSDSLRTRLEGLLCDLAPGELTAEQEKAEGEIIDLFEELRRPSPRHFSAAVDAAQRAVGWDDMTISLNCADLSIEVVLPPESSEHVAETSLRFNRVLLSYLGPDAARQVSISYWVEDPAGPVVPGRGVARIADAVAERIASRIRFSGDYRETLEVMAGEVDDWFEQGTD